MGHNIATDKNTDDFWSRLGAKEYVHAQETKQIEHNTDGT